MPDPGFPALTDAMADVFAEIAADLDPLHAYHRATALGLEGRELLDSAARARGVALARLARAERLTVTEVAARVGISKARASQLLALAGPMARPPAA